MNEYTARARTRARRVRRQPGGRASGREKRPAREGKVEDPEGEEPGEKVEEKKNRATTRARREG